jgi:hypothetical protein
MVVPGAHQSISRWLWLSLVLAGCVTDLRVGIKRDASTQGHDAGTPTDADAGSDAGTHGPCAPQDCETSAPDKMGDCDGGMPTCERNSDGICAWVPHCPPYDQPCAAVECDGPSLTAEDHGTCTDGSAPTCQRNPNTGVCSYQCTAVGACGTATGAACAAGSYCVFPAGVCGAGAGQGGTCAKIASSCDALTVPPDSSVCGCDGKTYASACDATMHAANIAFGGTCDGEPLPCDSCPGPAPDGPVLKCADSARQSGPVCTHTGGPSSACAWQWLDCPSPGRCDGFADLAPGRCYADTDCKLGQTCEGENVCPCNSECFSPEKPGYCK